MGLLDAIAGWFSSDSEPGPQLIVDGRAMLGTRAGQRLAPREMIDLLYRVGRFAEQEKLRSAVVFDGEPLHKAGDGDQFHGVTVYYATRPEQRVERLIELACAAARKGTPTLVSDDPEVERRAAEAGIGMLRCATLRKAMEPSGESEPKRRSGGPRRGERRDQRRRGRRSHRETPEAQAAPKTESSQPSPSAPNQSEAPPTTPSDPAVQRMVDLVDS